MFNSELKDKAINSLERSVNKYKSLEKKVQAKAADLFVLRKKSSESIIGEAQNYVNTLSNTPKEFDKSFSVYKAEFNVFTDMLNDVQIKSSDVNTNFRTTATAGVLAGVGTAALAPTAAMAVATTFGAASTGTAIASLSGAAATNAALAWLGGGTLLAGGGGMAGGGALLALAGPLGWAIGGAAIVGGGKIASNKNEKIAIEACEKRRKVEIEIAQLKSSDNEVSQLLSLTQVHVNGVNSILNELKLDTPNDYKLFSHEQKNCLQELVNHIHSLSTLLNKKVS